MRSGPSPVFGGGYGRGQAAVELPAYFRSEISETIRAAHPLPTLPRKTGEEIREGGE